MTRSLAAEALEAGLRREARLAVQLVLSSLASRGGRSGLAIDALRLSLSEGAGGKGSIEIVAWPPKPSGSGSRDANASEQSAAGHGR